jgi:hypothetical protein
MWMPDNIRVMEATWISGVPAGAAAAHVQKQASSTPVQGGTDTSNTAACWHIPEAHLQATSKLRPTVHAQPQAGNVYASLKQRTYKDQTCEH